MRYLIGCSIVVVLFSIAIVAASGLPSQGGNAPEAQLAKAKTTHEAAWRPGDDRLVVHEWGTFTSFSGSDGVRLEYRPLLDEDLPAFVLDRFLQSGAPQPRFGKFSIRARIRMETPVTYFYTDRERDVNVQVGFPEGLLTEFYPPVRNMAPEFKMGEELSLTNSLLDWGKVHLIPADRLQAQVDDPKLQQLIGERMLNGVIPADDGSNNHYFHARDTDSALVHVHLPETAKEQPLSPAGDFFEKFLFYRGVGNFKLPLTLSAQGKDQFALHNAGGDPVRSLFLVTVAGDDVRFSQYDEVAAGGTLKMTQSGQASSIDKLAEAVATALIGEGLYEKEARAMVATWRSSWFGESGTRLFYTVPERITNRLLPLQIEPQPDETVRVLVGRMEIMSPEDEAQITDVVRQSAALRAAAHAAAAAKKESATYHVPKEISLLGRLAEPALVRVRATTKDPVVRFEARQLLQQLKAGS